MSTPRMRLALTADLHWGAKPTGDAATRDLVAELYQNPPDVLVLAGDVGAGDDFARCLTLFDNLSCVKALVPGNHDIWVREDDERGDSWRVYHEHLPRLCAEHGFHYLDQGPLVLIPGELALAGSMNWYDYSWSLDRLQQQAADWQERLRTKRFSRGRHNDARFVRWHLDDIGFTKSAVALLEQHLQDASSQAARLVVVTHHPPFQELNFPQLMPGPPSLDRLLWEAFSGNHALEELLSHHAERVPLAFCGHTHYAREGTCAGIQGYNIGGDYHFKRLLRVEWPAGSVTATEFGNRNV